MEPEQTEVLSTEQVAALLGHRNLATTRNWLARWKITAVHRDTTSGMKGWPGSEVRAAIAAMPIGPASHRYSPELEQTESN